MTNTIFISNRGNNKNFIFKHNKGFILIILGFIKALLLRSVSELKTAFFSLTKGQEPRFISTLVLTAKRTRKYTESPLWT